MSGVHDDLATLRGIGSWLGSMANKTVSDADLVHIIPELERASDHLGAEVARLERQLLECGDSFAELERVAIRAVAAEAENERLTGGQDDAIEAALLSVAQAMFPDFDFSGCYDADDLRNHLQGQVAQLREEIEGLQGDVQFQYERRKGAEAQIARVQGQLADEMGLTEQERARAEKVEAQVARLRNVVLTLFREAEHDHQREEMWMTLREALGYGHNTGGVHDRWEEAVRALLAEDGAAQENSGIYEPRPGWPS